MSALDRLVSHLRTAEGSRGEWLYVPYSVRAAPAEHKEAAAELALLRAIRDEAERVATGRLSYRDTINALRRVLANGGKYEELT